MNIYTATVNFKVQYSVDDGYCRVTKEFSKDVVFYVQGNDVPEAYNKISSQAKSFMSDLQKVLRNFYASRYTVVKLELFISQQEYL